MKNKFNQILTSQLIPFFEGTMDKRPLGGTKEIYLNYLIKYCKIKTFETCKS